MSRTFVSTLHTARNLLQATTKPGGKSVRHEATGIPNIPRISDAIFSWQTRQSSGLQPDQQQSSSSSHQRAPQQTATAAADHTSKAGIDIKRNGVPEGHKNVSKSQMKGTLTIGNGLTVHFYALFIQIARC